MELTYTCQAEVWQWKGQGAWHFVTLPKDISQEIRGITADSRTGFGSIKVGAKVGKTSWKTSIFPDSKTNAYLLPLKKQVRLAENISDGQIIEIEFCLSGVY